MDSQIWIRPVFIVLFFILSCASSGAQKNVADLSPAHASAVQQFIRRQPQLEFLSERSMDPAILKDMRKNFGARLNPFYCVGDFNRDSIQDFAVILAKEGPPSEDLGPSLAETHRYRHEIAIVIFNGQKSGGYKVAFVKNTTAPLACFLYQTFEKRKRLYFAVYETDEHFIMAPAGHGYLVEYESDK